MAESVSVENKVIDTVSDDVFDELLGEESGPEDTVQSSIADLLSEELDDFLELPNTKTDFKKVKKPDNIDNNVCIVFHEHGEEANIMGAIAGLMCKSLQRRTQTHNVVVQTVIEYKDGKDKKMQLGFCDALTADKLFLCISNLTGANCTVYRYYGTPMQRQLTEVDLDKRPFRF